MLSVKSHSEIAKMNPFDTDRNFLLVNHRIRINPLSNIPKIQTKSSQYPNPDNIGHDERALGSTNEWIL